MANLRQRKSSQDKSDSSASSHRSIVWIRQSTSKILRFFGGRWARSTQSHRQRDIATRSEHALESRRTGTKSCYSLQRIGAPVGSHSLCNDHQSQETNVGSSAVYSDLSSISFAIEPLKVLSTPSCQMTMVSDENNRNLMFPDSVLEAPRERWTRLASAVPLLQKLSNQPHWTSTVIIRRSRDDARPRIPHFHHEPTVKEPGLQATIHPLNLERRTLPLTQSVSMPLIRYDDSTTTASGYCDTLSPISHPWSTGLASTVSETALTDPSAIRSFDVTGFENTCLPHDNNALATIDETTTPMPSRKLSMAASIALRLYAPDSEEPEIMPSVALVEKTASTKIFLEAQYLNKRDLNVTPRSLRRRDMEMSFCSMGMSPLEQEQVRAVFNDAETCYLRQIRKLKSRRTSEIRGIWRAGYEFIRILGKGSFGVVSLVREKIQADPECLSKKRPVYAMKVIKKSEMLRNCQEAHLRAERDFLVSCAENSRWVVPLVASFQDLNHLYLVMEFQIGGDFLNLLLNSRKGIISEEWAKFYVAEMVLCVEEAHRMKWIHRDIKPDNFLISASGHLKIADFGLAFDGDWRHSQSYYNQRRYSLLNKFGIRVQGDAEDQQREALRARKPRVVPKTLNGHVWFASGPSNAGISNDASAFQRKLARSVVGTSQYMAPEVVLGECYDGRCDWWSIGIIIYECLYGFTPFVREDRETTKRAIADFQTQFRFPQADQPISNEALNLMWQLLQNKWMRLGAGKYLRNDCKRGANGEIILVDEMEKMSYDFGGCPVYANDADEIKSHPFFAGMPWDDIHLTKPPQVPKVKSDDSTKYFDSEKDILADISDTYGDGPASPYPQTQQAGDRVADDLMNGVDGKRDKKSSRPATRARDKILRDPDYSDAVMDIRKKSAFLGYTYRRPTTWSLGDEMRLSLLRRTVRNEGNETAAT